MQKRRKEKDFEDDGRVIANMNIDGMPRSIIRRTAFDEFGKTKEIKEPIQLTKEERRSILLGVFTSYALFAVIVFGVYAMFILFCTNIWFK